MNQSHCLRQRILLVLAILLLAAGPLTSRGPEPPRSFLVTAALVVDGTGTPGRKVAARIVGDQLAEVGELAPRREERVVRANGFVLTPGFIDTHSHAENEIFEVPEALAAVSQGHYHPRESQTGSRGKKLLDSARAKSMVSGRI